MRKHHTSHSLISFLIIGAEKNWNVLVECIVTISSKYLPARDERAPRFSGLISTKWRRIAMLNNLLAGTRTRMSERPLPTMPGPTILIQKQKTRPVTIPFRKSSRLASRHNLIARLRNRLSFTLFD